MAKNVKEFDLTKGEVKKIYSAAKKANKGRLVELTGWYTEGVDEIGFAWVDCEICDAMTGEKLNGVKISCCTFNHNLSKAI